MKHLHLGIDPLNLATALRIIRLNRRPTPFIDGDGWECWGEAVGTDVNDRRTLHVVVEVPTRKHGRQLASALHAFSVLTPMARQAPRQQARDDANGAFAVITDPVDWSEKVSVHRLRKTTALLTNGCCS